MTRTCTYCSGPIDFATQPLSVVPAGGYLHADLEDCRRFLAHDDWSPFSDADQHALDRSVARNAGALEPGDDYSDQLFQAALLADDYTRPASGRPGVRPLVRDVQRSAAPATEALLLY